MLILGVKKILITLILLSSVALAQTVEDTIGVPAEPEGTMVVSQQETPPIDGTYSTTQNPCAGIGDPVSSSISNKSNPMDQPFSTTSDYTSTTARSNPICPDGAKPVVARKTVGVESKQTKTASSPFSVRVGPQVVRWNGTVTLKVDASGSIKVIQVSGGGSVSGTYENTRTMFSCVYKQKIEISRFIRLQKYVQYQGNATWYPDGSSWWERQPAQPNDVRDAFISASIC